MNDKKNESFQEFEKIGRQGIVIIGLILGIFWVTKTYEIFRQEKIYYIRSSVKDLKPDSPVLINEYKAGRISKIELLPESPKVLYEFRLAKRFQIPRTANYYISFDTLRAQNQLEIITALTSQPLEVIEEGDTINGLIGRRYGEVDLDSVSLNNGKMILRNIGNSLIGKVDTIQLEGGSQAEEQN